MSSAQRAHPARTNAAGLPPLGSGCTLVCKHKGAQVDGVHNRFARPRSSTEFAPYGLYPNIVDPQATLGVARDLLTRWPDPWWVYDPLIAQAGPSPPSAGCSTELRGRRPPNIEDPPVVAGGLSLLSPQKRTTTHTHLRPTRFAVSKVRRAKPGGTCPHSVANEPV